MSNNTEDEVIEELDRKRERSNRRRRKSPGEPASENARERSARERFERDHAKRKQDPGYYTR